MRLRSVGYLVAGVTLVGALSTGCAKMSEKEDTAVARAEDAAKRAETAATRAEAAAQRAEAASQKAGRSMHRKLQK